MPAIFIQNTELHDFVTLLYVYQNVSNPNFQTTYTLIQKEIRILIRNLFYGTKAFTISSTTHQKKINSAWINH